MDDQPLKDPQIRRFMAETVWAILPSKFLEIREVVRLHAAGVRLSAEEVRERIGVQAAKARPATAGGAIAVIPIQGVIVPKADLMTEISGGCSLETFTQAFREAMGDKSIGTILLDVDSPGGSAEMLREVSEEIRAARGRKRIVGVANTMAASAAYYLLAQCDEVFVTPSARIGCIGTIAEHQDISRLLEMEGVSITLIHHGEHKAEGNPFEPLTDEARAQIQKMVDQFGDMFVADVAKGRGVSVDVVNNTFGQGRMFGAAEAVRLGMADKVASRDQVISQILQGQPSTRRTRAEGEDLEVAATAQLVAGVTAAVGVPGTNLHLSGAALGAAASSASQSSAGATSAVGRTAEPSPTETKETTMEATTPGRMTRDELVARQDEIKARQEELDRDHSGELMPEDVHAEFMQLDEEHDLIEKTIAQLDDRRARVEAKAKQETSRVEIGGEKGVQLQHKRNVPENPFDTPAYRSFARSLDDLAGLYAEGAKHVLDGLSFESSDPEKAKSHIERLLKKDTKDGAFALRVLDTGSPLYDKAFGKLVMGKPLSAQEDMAIKAAVSHTGLATETPIPITIDPTVMLTSDGQSNPLRAISRVETITGPTWQGIASDGVEVAYEAELTQVADQTPDFTAPTATVAKAHGYVEFSIEVDQDWGSLRSNLATMFQDAKDAKEAEKFLFGTGTNEPHGIVTALEGGPSVIDSGTGGTLDISDLDLLADELPPRFDARAQWMGNRGVFSALRALAGERTDFWVPLSQGFRNTPSGNSGYTLLGYPVNYASGMSRLVTTDGEQVLILGDFSRGFLIVDRVGLNVEIIPHVLGANRRPIGARAMYVFFRNTSEVIIENAFRMLRIEPS